MTRIDVQRPLVVVGSPSEDTIFKISGQPTVREDWLEFIFGGSLQVIQHEPPKIAWGQTRTGRPFSAADWSGLDTVTRPGGGAVHSCVHLSEMIEKRGLQVRPVFVTAGRCSRQLQDVLRNGRTDSLFLNIESTPHNLVMSNGLDQIVVRTPTYPSLLSGSESMQLRRGLRDSLQGDDLKVVLFNSPKCQDLAKLVSDVAIDCGAAQYTVLTDSLTPSFRQQVLWPRSAAVIADHTEFCKVAADAGFACSNDESHPNLDQIANGMVGVAQCSASTDVIVTLGQQGCIVLPAGRSNPYLIALRKNWKIHVNDSVLAAREDQTIGHGGWFAASFVLSHDAQRGISRTRRTVSAALQASIDTIQKMTGGLSLDFDAFEIFDVLGTTLKKPGFGSRISVPGNGDAMGLGSLE